MRIVSKEAFAENSFIELKNSDWLNKQRVAGKVVAKTLSLLKQLVIDKTTKSLLELNSIAEEYIYNSGCTPTFKGYKGFPSGVCISVNKELVHGIPKDYKLEEGDVVSFDLGATFDGAIADSAITCIFGNAKDQRHIELINATEECLNKAISSIETGKQLGVIGYTISKYAKSNNFGLVTHYGGHGLSWNNPHTAPFVPNKSNLNEGIRIQPGLSIAIEPMLVIGDNSTKVLQDGWTVVTENIGAHAEHTIFIHSDHVEIITNRENL
jgi:methionyl aminopeptidase